MQAVSLLVLDGERAIEAVVDDVQSRERELRADLVRDARVDRDLEKRPLLVLNHGPPDRTKLRHRMQGLHSP